MFEIKPQSTPKTREHCASVRGGPIQGQPHYDHGIYVGLKLSPNGSQAMIVAFNHIAGRQEVSLPTWLVQFLGQVCEWH